MGRVSTKYARFNKSLITFDFPAEEDLLHNLHSLSYSKSMLTFFQRWFVVPRGVLTFEDNNRYFAAMYFKSSMRRKGFFFIGNVGAQEINIQSWTCLFFAIRIKENSALQAEIVSIK